MLRFTTRKSREDNILLPIYIVQVSPNSNIGKLLKINRINYLIVSWEKIKKNNIIQCHKCQLIGHTAQNCNLNYRCVNCTEPHGPGECKIKKEDAVSKEKNYYVNCKNFGHPASYKGCPKLAELRKKLNKKVIKAKTTKTKVRGRNKTRNKHKPGNRETSTINKYSSVRKSKPQPNGKHTTTKHSKRH